MILLGRNPHLSTFALPKKEDEDIVYKVMEDLDIIDLKNTRVNKMSGGQLQMVLIARALVNRPQILILDEPESNLDFRNQLKILNTIKRFAGNSEITCIFNTHYPQHAYRIADKSLLFGDKNIYYYGEVEDVLTEKNIMNIFKVEISINDVLYKDESWKNITPLALI